MTRPPLPCLLLAGAVLTDPNFHRAVVLLLEWDDESAFGLVLNRPTDLLVAEPLPDWERLVVPPAVVHVGGPVQPEVALGLDVTTGVPPSLVDLTLPPDAIGTGRIRVFAGYTGWGPGQLDDEIGLEAWHLAGWRPEDLVPGRGPELWRTVMRRQPGKVAFESTYPDDLSVN